MFDLQFQYRSLFTLQVRHEYFAENVLNYFDVELSASSVKLLNRLGLLFKKSENGYHFIYDETDKERTLYVLERLEEFDKLTLHIYTSYPYFVNVTAITPEITQRTLYFSNLATYQHNEKELMECLHSQPYIQSQQTSPVRSRYFEYHSVKKEGKIDLIEESGKVHASDLPIVEYRCRFNVANDGKFRLVENGKVVDEFVCLDMRGAKKPIAIVDFYVGGIIKEKILKKIYEDSGNVNFSYYIAFATRESLWRYHIIPKYSANLTALAIIPIEEAVSFKGPTEEYLPNGQKALVFESSKVLALKEIPHYHFQLKKGDGSLDNPVKTVIERLPVPGVSAIKPSKEKNAGLFVSDIFVYI